MKKRKSTKNQKQDVAFALLLVIGLALFLIGVFVEHEALKLGLMPGSILLVVVGGYFIEVFVRESELETLDECPNSAVLRQTLGLDFDCELGVSGIRGIAAIPLRIMLGAPVGALAGAFLGALAAIQDSEPKPQSQGPGAALDGIKTGVSHGPASGAQAAMGGLILGALVAPIMMILEFLFWALVGAIVGTLVGVIVGASVLKSGSEVRNCFREYPGQGPLRVIRAASLGGLLGALLVESVGRWSTVLVGRLFLIPAHGLSRALERIVRCTVYLKKAFHFWK